MFEMVALQCTSYLWNISQCFSSKSWFHVKGVFHDPQSYHPSFLPQMSQLSFITISRERSREKYLLLIYLLGKFIYTNSKILTFQKNNINTLAFGLEVQ